MKRVRNPWLVAGGCLSLLAASLHLAVIAGGPDWYRAFGAGEGMANAAAAGSMTPVVATLAIAVVLASWAAYAFSGAGMIRRLPLLRTALVAITFIYLARGLFILAPSAFARPDLSPTFMFWSSLVVLIYGLVHAMGTFRAWPTLSRNTKVAYALGS